MPALEDPPAPVEQTPAPESGNTPPPTADPPKKPSLVTEGATLGETLAAMRGEKPPGAPPKTPPPPIKTPPADTDPFHPELLAWAKDAGLDEAEARSWGTPEVLEKHLVAHDKHVRAMGKLRTPTQPQQPATVPQPKADPPAPATTDESFKPYVFKADDDFDDKTLNAFAAHVHKQIESLRAANERAMAGVSQISSASANRELASFAGMYEQFIDSLGAEWHDVFGKEKASVTLRQRPDSAEAKAHQALIAELDNWSLGRGRLPTPDEANGRYGVFRRTLASVFPEKLETLATRKVKDSLQQRAGQAIGKPTSRVDSTTRPSEDETKPRPGETREQYRARRGAEVDRQRGIRPSAAILN